MPPLRILQVALGYIPIPPVGYGGIESIIWEMTTRLRARGHTVDIVNQNKHRVFWDVLRAGRYDFVHCHHERGLSRVQMAVNLGRKGKLLATTHRGYFHDRLDADAEKCLRMTARADYQMALREDTLAALRLRNPRIQGFIQPNGTEVKDFRLAERGNGRAICLAMVEPRKRQDFVARFDLPVDFVGPIKEPILPPDARYLGEWTREQIREELTEYSVLILVSDREGGGPPLVVSEALSAGLSVVLSPPCAGNLDLNKPFIRVCADDDSFPGIVHEALAQADGNRLAAREYALQNLDWDVLVQRYEEQLLRWRDA